MNDRDEFTQHLAHVARMAEMAYMLVRRLPAGLPGALSFNPWPHLLSRCHVCVLLHTSREVLTWLDALEQFDVHSAGVVVDGPWVRRRFILPSFQALEVYLVYPFEDRAAQAEVEAGEDPFGTGDPFSAGDPFAAFIETLDL